MERVASQEDIVDQGAERSGCTPYEILIIASMIEREAKTDEDRPKIARVIYNRLASGMPLQIDATVRYGTALAGGDPTRSRSASSARRRAVQHVPAHRAAADADRQPGPGVDPGRAQPGAEPERRRPAVRGPARGHAVRVPVLRARRRGRATTPSPSRPSSTRPTSTRPPPPALLD